MVASAQTEDLCPDDPNKVAPGICGCGVADTDTDGDGTLDCEDLCPVHSFKVEPGLCGCGIPDVDTDGDGTPNCHDWCPYDPDNTWPGYWSPDRDADGDGTIDGQDWCPYDPDKTSPGICGCYNPDIDTNGDGMPDCVDLCPLDPDSNAPTVCGCGVGAWNRDIWPTQYGGNDMIPDCVDGCPMDYYKYDPGLCGCFISDVADTDGDGTPDCKDECPGDSTSTTPPCKCGDEAAADSDGDGTPDCADLCLSDQDKIFGGMCGCNSDDNDTDGDGAPDCLDFCEYNPVLRWEGECGCDESYYDVNGIPLDTDGDGRLDCMDACPDDGNKTETGICGCGVADIDTDHDGCFDCPPFHSGSCYDQCPEDFYKQEPGICGCGVVDSYTDSDGDGAYDCNDLCPYDVNKTEPGICGCGVVDSSVDSDVDGIPNCIDQCPGFNDTIDIDGDGVGDCIDKCPTDPNKTDPGQCGCFNPDTDTDEDGTADCNDGCPINPYRDDSDYGTCASGPDDCNLLLIRCASPLRQVCNRVCYDGVCYPVDSSVCDYVGLDGFFTNKDGDGLPDYFDGCPEDPLKTEPGVCGCGLADTDSDNDGTADCQDLCPDDPNKAAPGACGCGLADTDSDNDGTADCQDLCPDDPNKVAPGACGCGLADRDTDGDLRPDCRDDCPVDPNKVAPGACGCGKEDSDTDTDGDGTPDCQDLCPDDPNKVAPGIYGCGMPDTDSDGDGYLDCNDGCPLDPNKTEPGVCGCGVADTDTDGDGTPDCEDLCPAHSFKVEPGICGCGIPDVDTDGDGTPNCHDWCPYDSNKTWPGTCGCGLPDTGPCGTDYCPADPYKIAPGVCGCSYPDRDADGDGTMDCQDWCPYDPDKTSPGVCGCYNPDIDTNGDGTPDCVDLCPLDPDSNAPTVCGCGVPETDRDGDGYPWCVDECDENRDMIKRSEICGCECPDIDTDGDGWLDCMDACPEDRNKYEAPGICGCGVPDTDTDGDGTADCNDACPHDPDKIEDDDTDDDGVLDCNDQCPGEPDTDSDGDGVANCRDECPFDPSKFEGYVEFDHCDCGVPDIDTDGDGWLDCFDLCPFNAQWGHTESNCYGGTGQECKFYEIITVSSVLCVPACPYILDHGGCDDGDPETYDYCDPDVGGCRHIPDACPDDPDKATPGVCGCGVPDTDSDGDGTADCNEPCPGGASVETCNGLDDDCNGLTDEKIITYMNSVTAYSDGSSLTMTLPTVQAGDFLIAQVTFRNDSAIGTIPTPEGWSALPRVNNDADRFGQIIYYRTVAADATDQEFTFAFPGELHSAGGIIRYTGVDGISSYSSYVGSDYLFQLPGVSAEPGSRLVVFLNKLGDECIGWPVSLNSTRLLALMNDVYTRNNPGNLTIRVADERVSGTSTDIEYLSTWSDSPWIVESVVLDPGSVCAGDTEVCDGIDNDDDGLIDEGNPGGGVACDTGLPGVCSGGITNCSRGELICEQTTTSSVEVCDSLDNDCDGSVDEDLGTTNCGVGVCEHTVNNCVGGVPQTCDAMEGASTEVCNGLDDDCNGIIDDGLTAPDADNQNGVCVGLVKVCSGAGGWVEPTYPITAEVCDGLDNDCDGSADEDLGTTTCGLGVCEHTVNNCVGGAPQTCDAMEGASTEVCDGLDNDCDGSVDEDLGTTTCGLGVCEHTVNNCVGGAPQTCDAMEGASTEVCNGLDDDCNGIIDDGLTAPDADNQNGVCVGLVKVCSGAGGWVEPTYPITAEVCDGLDNDCDGSADEDLGTTTCGLGVCEHTVNNCVGGAPQTCDAMEGASTEVCNGLDDDCNGIIDDGLDAMMTIINGSQTVQYSDKIDTITLTVTNIPADFVNATLTLEWNVNSGAFTSSLPMNLVIKPDDLDPEVIDTGATCVVNETNPLLYWDCSWNISGSLGVPAGIYTLKATLSENDGGTPNTSATITVLPENASCKFDADNPVSVRVESDGEDSGDFSLFVDVKEKQPDLPADYNLPGEIGLAQVDMSLVHVGSGGSIPADECTNVTVPDGYNAIKTFECYFDNVPVDAYTIAVTIDGDSYYAGSCEDVLVVYDPSLGFTTGGGKFLWDGDETNFGYTMKYNKKATNIQGNLLLIRHHLEDEIETIYRVKSNALYGLALGEDTSVPMGWASFSGKSTYLEPGMSEPEGNYEFIVYVEDRNEPGTGVDRFWIQINGGESISMPAELNAIELIGGNIVVPHKAASKDEPKNTKNK